MKLERVSVGLQGANCEVIATDSEAFGDTA